MVTKYCFLKGRKRAIVTLITAICICAQATFTHAEDSQEPSAGEKPSANQEPSVGQEPLAFEDTSSYETPEPKDYYQIEYILFKQADPDWSVLKHSRVQRPYTQKAQYLTLYPSVQLPPSEFQRAKLNQEESFTLANTAAQLRRSGYAILDEGAWYEAIDKDSRTLPVRLNSKQSNASVTPFWQEYFDEEAATEERPHHSQDNSGLSERYEGELTIRRSRYLHAEVELNYLFEAPVLYSKLVDYLIAPAFERQPLTSMIVPDTSLALSTTNHHYDTSMLTTRSFSFTHSRRVKVGEIHYLDHPYLGMIVTIKRAPEELTL